jgi:hypothetical protein
VKPRLLFPDRDLQLDAPLPPGAETLVADLAIDVVLDAMAQGDDDLRAAARAGLFAELTSVQDIAYRQAVLYDCLCHPDVVRNLYAVAVDTLGEARRLWRGSSPDTLLYGSVSMLEIVAKALRALRRVADEHVNSFDSAGFVGLFRTVQRELDDAWFEALDAHLARLRFPHGTLISARLGAGNKATDLVLRRPLTKTRSWRQRVGLQPRDGFSFQLPDRDEAGARALSQFRARGVALVATAVAQSADHVVTFFRSLRAELAFYLAALNLYDQLVQRGVAVSFPQPQPPGAVALEARGLCDVALCLLAAGPVVGNDLGADGVPLVVITGANQGGKSTFLRSVGLAQLMMQAGLFVAAEAYTGDVASGLFTHFRREEDEAMRSGKFDEELRRMSAIADELRPGAMVLFNESFAATNEREGAQVAEGIVCALLDSGVKVIFVTHLYALADGLRRRHGTRAVFLRAARNEDGSRPYRIEPGVPSPTSFGADLLTKVFGGGDEGADGGGDNVTRPAGGAGAVDRSGVAAHGIGAGWPPR